MKETNIRSMQPRNYLTQPRTAHEFDSSFRNDLDFTGEVSLTKQSEADACDINNIMKKYEATGILPEMIKTQPSYGDFSATESFQEALGIVAHAQTQFQSLDAHIRARFLNDPARFLEFCNNPQNLGEMVKMGLAVARPEKTIDPEIPLTPKKSAKQPAAKPTEEPPDA